MLKTLSKSIRQYKKSSIITALLSVAEVAFEIILPLVMSSLIDFGIEEGSLPAIWKYGIILFLVALLQLGSGIFSAFMASKASVGLGANLREDMYGNIQTFAFSNIDKFSTSSIITRLTTDVTNIQMAYQMILRLAVRAPIMMLIAIIVCFTISTPISIMFVIAVPVLGFVLYFIAIKVHPLMTRVFKTYDLMNNRVQEDVRGIRVVKSFNRENYESEKFMEISEEVRKGYTKAERLIAFNSPVMQLCIYICMILISWIGAKAIIASGNNPAIGLTTGNLTALFTYAMQILTSLMMLSMVFVLITIAGSSAKRISEVLDEKTDISNPKDPVLTVKSGDVEYRNVNFVYSSDADKNVLDNINISIRSGETVGIIGGTGSSKTSLVQLIPRLYDTTSGEVLIGGVNVKNYDLDTLRNAVGIVLQKNELFAGTIAENLRWGNENASDEELRNAAKLACADEFIDQMPKGYDTYIEQGGVNVSGGQKQRLCIARTLLKKPQILIMDDSTSAVDTETDAKIRKAMAEFIPATTKIIIAQRISSVMHADKIFVMDDGKIVASGTHESLMADSAIYREVFESQQKKEKGGSANE